MKKTIMFAVALGLSSVGAWAQDTQTDAAPKPEVAAEADPAKAPEKAQPEPRTVGEFGPWTVTCSDMGQGTESCLARQEISLSDQENGPKLTVFLEKSGADQPTVLTVGTPTGIAIQPGVSLILNETDKARVWYAPFESCLQTMCIASAAVNEKVLMSSKEPAIAFSLANYELVGVKFSTEGVEDAVKSLVENAPVPVKAPVPEAAPSK